MPCVEERGLLLYTERRVHLFYTRHRVSPLLYVEEADSFSVQGSIVFSTHPRGCPSAMCRGGLALYTEYIVSPMQSGESVPPPTLCNGESVFSSRG